MKKSILFHLFLILFVFTSFAQAGTKEELMRLQQDVITLQNQFRAYESTLNENNTSISGLKTLIEQLNDQVAKSNMLLEKVLSAIEQQPSGNRSEENEILPEIQSLSNKIDDMAMSLSALARQVSDLKIQSTPINTSVSSDLSSADALYDQAFNDLLDENYDLAISGFNTYLTQFPNGNKATDALYNIGAAYFYKKQYQQAIDTFTRVIEENADSAKVALALLRRGEAFLENKNTDMAIKDFKEVIKRYPDASEAALAKDNLQNLGVAD
jgi:tol-pal system protein YbgF